MQILLSVLAFFFGFVALWCAASVQTRIQRHIEDDGNARAVAIESAIAELANRIQALDKSLTKVDKTLARVREARAEDSRTLAILKRRAHPHDEDRPEGHDGEASRNTGVA